MLEVTHRNLIGAVFSDLNQSRAKKMASTVLSSATSSMPPITIDLTRYKRKLAEVCELGKAEVDSLRSHDAEQLRFDQSLKATNEQKTARKQRASSCTHSVNHGVLSASRGHSVPRVADDNEKIEIDGHLTCCEDDNMKASWEPSISGYNGQSNESEPMVRAKTGARRSSHFRGRGRGRRSTLRVDASKEEASVSSASGDQDGNNVVTKTSTPSTVRRTLGMRFSLATPLSQRRLSIPRRQYSPEPVKKPRLSLGNRKPLETIRLSDLTEKLATLEREEFSLPEDFIAYRRRQSPAVGEQNQSSELPVHEEAEEGRRSLRAGFSMSTRRSNFGEKSTSVLPASSSVSDDSAKRRKFLRPSLSAQKEMNASGGVSGVPLVKRKRGRPRKVPLEMSAASESFLDSTLDASIFDEHSEEEPALKIDESFVQKDDTPVHDVDKTASGDAVAGSSTEAETANVSVGEQMDTSRKSEKEGSLDLFGSENQIMKEDFDEESNHKLCIAENEEDSVVDIGKSGTDNENLLNGGEEPMLGIAEKVGAELPVSTVDISEPKVQKEEGVMNLQREEGYGRSETKIN